MGPRILNRWRNWYWGKELLTQQLTGSSTQTLARCVTIRCLWANAHFLVCARTRQRRVQWTPHSYAWLRLMIRCIITPYEGPAFIRPDFSPIHSELPCQASKWQLNHKTSNKPAILLKLHSTTVIIKIYYHFWTLPFWDRLNSTQPGMLY